VSLGQTAGERTSTLPSMSFFTGEKATEPSRSSGHESAEPCCTSRTARGGEATKHGGEGLGSFEELGRRDGVTLGGIDGHLGEVPLHGVEVGTSCGDLCGRHVCWYCWYFGCSSINKSLVGERREAREVRGIGSSWRSTTLKPQKNPARPRPGPFPLGVAPLRCPSPAVGLCSARDESRVGFGWQ